MRKRGRKKRGSYRAVRMLFPSAPQEHGRSCISIYTNHCRLPCKWKELLPLLQHYPGPKRILRQLKFFSRVVSFLDFSPIRAHMESWTVISPSQPLITPTDLKGRWRGRNINATKKSSEQVYHKHVSLETQSQPPLRLTGLSSRRQFVLKPRELSRVTVSPRPTRRLPRISIQGLWFRTSRMDARLVRPSPIGEWHQIGSTYRASAGFHSLLARLGGQGPVLLVARISCVADALVLGSHGEDQGRAS